MLILSARNLPDLEASLDCMRVQARGLTERHPAIDGCRLELGDAVPPGGYEARIELRLAQRKVIANARAAEPRLALAAAVARIDHDLAHLG